MANANRNHNIPNFKWDGTEEHKINNSYKVDDS